MSPRTAGASKGSMRLFVVGAGRLGRTLALASQTAGLPLLGCWNRTPVSARATRRLLGTRCSSGRLPAAVGRADLILLCVSDEAIAPMARRLASSGLLGPGQGVVHCAGALGLDVLRPCAAVGAHTGSFHPLRAFVDPRRELESLPGTLTVIEGNPDLRPALVRFARTLGLAPMTLRGDPQTRARYHAAAVSVSGNLCALFDSALELTRAAGLPDNAARSGLLSLARGVLDAIERERSPAAALTGPVARGDESVIRRHRQAMKGLSPDLRRIYDALVARSRGLADQRP